MGSNRKRLADQMSSSGDGAEDTRTDKKNKSGRKKKDKKRGKKDGKASKGSKGKPSKSNKDGTSAGTSLETTATAEGKQMAQVLSTFSRLEQSRFEAFRKAAFHGDAISKYVAHCLIHEQHRPVSAGSTSSTASNAKTKARFRNLRPNTHYQRRLELSELVAPGQAQDITVVVSTLAKEYAQRLVLAARRYATERQSNSDNDDDPSTSESAAISPEDLLKAHADRQARDLDPGFFLQQPITKDARSQQTSLFLKDPDSHQRYSLTRSVALAAQEEYDQDQTEEETETSKENSDNVDAMNVESNGDVEMNIDDEEEEKSEEEATSDEEEEEDPSEQAMRLFALHVNRVIARQNGITVVTSDDEEETSKKEEETKLPATTPSSAAAPASTMVNEGEANPPTPPNATSKAEVENATSTEANDDSTKTDQAVPMDTSDDALASTGTENATKGVETSGGDSSMSALPENSTNAPPEQAPEASQQMQEVKILSPPSESQTDAPTVATKPALAAEEKPQTKAQEESAPSQADAPAASTTTEGVSEAADDNSGETKEAKKEQEVIMIDDD